MTDVLLKTNITGFVKNSHSPLIINTDVHKLNKIMKERQKLKADIKFKNEMLSLKNDVSELKEMFKEFIKCQNH